MQAIAFNPFWQKKAVIRQSHRALIFPSLSQAITRTLCFLTGIPGTERCSMFPALQSGWMFSSLFTRRFYSLQQKCTNFFWHQRGSALRSLRWQSGFTMYIDVLFAGSRISNHFKALLAVNLCKSSETVRSELFYAVEAVEVEAGSFE